MRLRRWIDRILPWLPHATAYVPTPPRPTPKPIRYNELPLPPSPAANTLEFVERVLPWFRVPAIELKKLIVVLRLEPRRDCFPRMVKVRPEMIIRSVTDGASPEIVLTGSFQAEEMLTVQSVGVMTPDGLLLGTKMRQFTGGPQIMHCGDELKWDHTTSATEDGS